MSCYSRARRARALFEAEAYEQPRADLRHPKWCSGRRTDGVRPLTRGALGYRPLSARPRPHPYALRSPPTPSIRSPLAPDPIHTLSVPPLRPSPPPYLPPRRPGIIIALWMAQARERAPPCEACEERTDDRGRGRRRSLQLSAWGVRGAGDEGGATCSGANRPSQCLQPPSPVLATVTVCLAVRGSRSLLLTRTGSSKQLYGWAKHV